MKVGIVGVGPWGATMARAFTKQGAIIVHDRYKNESAAPIFGKRVLWCRMLDDGPDRVDAIVLATPPPVTFQIARMAIERGVATLATKPLVGAKKLAEMKLRAPFFVDYVHLFSPCYRKLKEMVQAAKRVDDAWVEFVGDGPIRGFSPLLDYGSHAVAIAIDLFGGSKDPAMHSAMKSDEGGRANFRARFHIAHVPVDLLAGNAWAGNRRIVTVSYDCGKLLRYAEWSYPDGCRAELADFHGLLTARNHDPLGALVSEFMAATLARSRDRSWLRLSARVETLLTKIQRATVRRTL